MQAILSGTAKRHIKHVDESRSQKITKQLFKKINYKKKTVLIYVPPLLLFFITNSIWKKHTKCVISKIPIPWT